MTRFNQLIRILRGIRKVVPFPIPKWASEFVKQQQKITKETDLHLLYFPTFKDNQTYTDHYYRMVWYLNPIVDRISQITFLYGDSPLRLEAFPDYLDPKIKDLEHHFADKITYVNGKDTDTVVQITDQADLVMLWQSDINNADYIPDTPLKPLVQNKLIRRIDPINEQYSGSIYLYTSSDIGSQAQELADSKDRFSQMVQELSTDTIYIFGTGPNLQQVSDYDFGDGMCIACNSMVKNKELMHRLNPPLIAMADPIFHAGCSSYAGEFRKYLIESMDTFDSYLVVPMRDYRLYMANLPQKYQDKIIGIPFLTHTEPNLDLTQQFNVSTTANVMTLFLLPLACTLGKSIYMAGFDGRPLDEDDYFWKHDPKSQIVDKMADIKQAHPGFFAIDYNDYYMEHINITDKWLAAAKARGHNLYNLTPSHVPAIQNHAEQVDLSQA